MAKNIFEYESTRVTFKTGYQNISIQGRSEEVEHVPDIILETTDLDSKETCFICSFFGTETVFEAPMSYEEASQNVFHRGLHQHDYFELIYVVRGSMYQIIGNERHLYPTGSLCLLNKNVRHREEYTTDYSTVFLALPATLVQELLEQTNTYFFKCERDSQTSLHRRFFTDNMKGKAIQEYIDFIPDPENITEKKKMHSLFDSLIWQFLEPDVGSTYIIKSIIARIFWDLAQDEFFTTVPVSIAPDAETELFGGITAFLKSRNGRVSRMELEEELNYSSHYLNRIVKRHTGLSLLQYGKIFAMEEAAGLLKHTDLPIADICEHLHFSNQTQFYRQFQQAYGITPKEYRNNFTGRTYE